MIGGGQNQDSHSFLRNESKSAPLQQAGEALTVPVVVVCAFGERTHRLLEGLPRGDVTQIPRGRKCSLKGWGPGVSFPFCLGLLCFG